MKPIDHYPIASAAFLTIILVCDRHRPPWWPENECASQRPPWWPKQHGRRGTGVCAATHSFAEWDVFSLGLLSWHSWVCLGFFRFILAPFIDFPGAPPFDRPDFIFPLGFLGFILLVFTVGWGARSLRRMSTPLDDLFDASNQVADGDYSVRVEEKGPPEIYSLMRGFNSMAERLQVNDQQRRNMLADVSHELRTPITVIQGNVEGILDGLYPADEARLKSIIEETQILSRLVDDLRTLALAESGALHLKREPTNLAELIRDAVSGFEAQAKEKEIKVEHVAWMVRRMQILIRNASVRC